MGPLRFRAQRRPQSSAGFATGTVVLSDTRPPYRWGTADRALWTGGETQRRHIERLRVQCQGERLSARRCVDLAPDGCRQFLRETKGRSEHGALVGP